MSEQTQPDAEPTPEPEPQPAPEPEPPLEGPSMPVEETTNG